MSPDIPPPADQSGPDFGPGHRDPDRPSLRVLLAAVLLRQGRRPHDVARATRVPLALIELINEHLDQDPSPADPTAADLAGRPDPTSAAHDAPIDGQASGAAFDATARPVTEASAGTDAGRPPCTNALLGRRFRWSTRAVRVALLLNAALAVTAAATHTHALAEASLIAFPVTTAVGLGLLWAHHARLATRLARIGQPDPRQP